MQKKLPTICTCGLTHTIIKVQLSASAAQKEGYLFKKGGRRKVCATLFQLNTWLHLILDSHLGIIELEEVHMQHSETGGLITLKLIRRWFSLNGLFLFYYISQEVSFPFWPGSNLTAF